jgi:hypothetical protein
MDCRVACAPRSDGASSRFNCQTAEGRCVLAISRRDASELCDHVTLFNNERARGRPGADCTRGSRATKSTGVGPQVQPEHPAFPAQWLYGLLRALPGEIRLGCLRHPHDACASRGRGTCHWGARTTRLRRTPACALVKRAANVHRIPPHVRDDHDTPLLPGGMERFVRVSWGWSQEYF